MIDLELNTANDLKIEEYDLQLIKDEDQVAQNISIKLQMYQGEWFLNTKAGVPYYESILVKNPDGAAIDSLLKKAILTVDGVNELLEYEADFDEDIARLLTVSFKVNTIFGTVSGST